ncbi:MAG TPA: NADPH:quinone oxidoreductase family protein [Acidimicrobiia bacterium]|nr:NADPH:quinone oxidoreductase family protein [Acidimicrobiia bacterium]
MRAWRLHEHGAPADVLTLEDGVEPPTPGPGQVRLQMAATGLNFFEDLMCRGQYQEKPPLPLTPGAELCGRVVEVGEGVDLPIGVRMIGMAAWPHGGLAEQALGNARMLFPIPDSMPDEVGAALFMTYGTSHVALHRRGGLQAGETLLVHAGAGGVGSAAIQLGVAAGARVIATAGGPEKVDVCRKLGAEVAIDYKDEDFVAAVKEATGGKGADVIYDPVGGDVFDQSLRCIAWEGRLLVIGFTSGRIPAAPANLILLKNVAVTGVHFGAYARHDPGIFRRTHDELVSLYGAGRIDPLVHRVLPLEEAVSGLTDLANRRTVGKVVVRIAG